MGPIVRLMKQSSLCKMLLTGYRWTPVHTGSLTVHRPQSSVASPLMRSLLVLKYSPKSFEHPTEAKADVYLMDLEDGVPKAQKDSALKLYAQTLQSRKFFGQTVYVRISDVNDTARTKMEVEKLCHIDLTGFMVPKVASPHDIKKIDEIISEVEKINDLPHGNFTIMPIIEDFDGFLHAHSIAKASSRTSALITGKSDFAACFYRRPDSPVTESLQLRVLHAAKAAGVAAIDNVTHLDNYASLERDVLRGKSLGFDGLVVLHPSLVPFVNQLYSPTRQEIEWAEAVVSGVRVYQRSPQECQHFISPSNLACASQILQRQKQIYALEASQGKTETPVGKSNEDLGTVIPCRWKGGASNVIKGGGVIPGLLPMTMDSSLRTAWSSSFLNTRRLNSAVVSAREIGLPGIQPPHHLLAVLSMSLAVSKLPEAARYHLGIYNVVQLRPVIDGDTIRAYVSLDKVEEAGSSGKYSIVTSHHVLLNDRDEAVFRVMKRTMYPRLAIKEFHSNKAKKWRDLITAESELREDIIQKAHLRGKKETIRSLPLMPNELYVHRHVKAFSPGESKRLCTLLHITNSHNHNTQKFSTDDVVVPGPFSVAAAVHNVAEEFGDILYEEVIECSNINRVNMDDVIGSISYILSVDLLEENTDLEEVTVRTLGIMNMDVDDLLARSIPVRLFTGRDVRSAEYEKICKEEFPKLYKRIGVQVLWKFLRLRPSSSNDIATGFQTEPSEEAG